MRHSLRNRVAAVATVALSACATLSRDQPAAPLVLTADDRGRAVSIRVAQEFVVRLASNPTTGYRWVARGSLDGVIDRVGDAVFVQDPSGGRVGVGGVELWQFRGVRTGKTTLSFAYRRPWEDPSAPAETIQYRITVR